MQRRAAAVYVAFFLIVGAASYSLIATAEQPTINFEDPAYSLNEGDDVTIGGTQYHVQSLTAEMVSSGGGGHGGGGGSKTLQRSGTLTWTNQSAKYTATWKNGSTVTFQGEQYIVRVTGNKTFELVEDINRTAILKDDPNAENETVTQNGKEYVVVHQEEGSDNKTLVPAEDYFPEPETTQYREGDTVSYQGNQTTFATVTSDAVTLVWHAPKQLSVDVEHRANVTLSGQTYLAFFPNNNTLYLVQDYQSYQHQTEQIHTFHEHVAGLWGITILSGLASILLLGMAYLPSRY